MGYEMLKRGLATVYEAKDEQYSEFGGAREKYERAQQRAKESKLGIWGGRVNQGVWRRIASFAGFAGKQVHLESPREYKSRMMKKKETDGKTRS